MGPILFIIHINDLLEISKFVKFILNATDANISVLVKLLKKYAKAQNIYIICRKISKRVYCYGLVWNLNTIFLEQKLFIANIVIERKTLVRFLDVITDENLSWSTHI